LSILTEIPLEQTLWHIAGLNAKSLRAHGIIVPFPDLIIATAALQYDLEVWACDSHFKMMQAALPALGLFQHPAFTA
jgi:predicted nucleic acid-binding protein